MLLLLLPLLLSLLLSIPSARAAVTVYHQSRYGVQQQQTLAANPAQYTGPPAYNPTTLIPPPVPTPQIPTKFNVQVQLSPPAPLPNLSIPLSGSFFGFSIEMSVANQVLGKNSTLIQVPFLNLMSNLVRRGREVHIRVGGNTQEQAVLVDSLPNGRILEKDLAGVSNPTQTPPLKYTTDLLYLMANISQLTNVHWYLGIPFNDTANLRLGIVEQGQKILGSKLLGLQAGNEPDLYARHGHRQPTYGPQDYMGELDVLVQAMAAHPDTITSGPVLVAPNIATGDWTPQMIIDAGFVPRFAASLAAVAVEHYPTDNCFAQFGIGINRSAQDVFGDFLSHGAAQGLVAPYAGLAVAAQGAQRPLLMFETNTASCGGFAGVSDSFGAALWALDYALQMGYVGFSGALFHVGGQSVFYNPFTPPPTNQSAYHQWTVGPLYYAALATAETLGASNTAQVVDVSANGSPLTPAYVVYEHGVPVRVALINFVSDPSGASDLLVGVGGLDGGTAGTTVQVKYLRAPSVASKANITWANQTFGGVFESDGRPRGDEEVQSVVCGATTCDVPVPAPGFALVFLRAGDAGRAATAGAAAAADADAGAVPATQTFATTAGGTGRSRGRPTVTVDPAVLATSNGHRRVDVPVGSTSRGRLAVGAQAQASGARGLGGVGWRSVVGGVLGGFGAGLVLARV